MKATISIRTNSGKLCDIYRGGLAGATSTIIVDEYLRLPHASLITKLLFRYAYQTCVRHSVIPSHSQLKSEDETDYQ